MARLLYLLRHGKSSWADEGLDDVDRPLARRGREAGERLARHFEQETISPDLVLCSPALRARQTLAAVRETLPDGTAVEEAPWLYREGAATILRKLRELPDDVDSVMLVGHNPELQAVALALAGSGDELERLRAKLPTGALATLTISAPSWSDVDEDSAELTAFVVPRDLP